MNIETFCDTSENSLYQMYKWNFKFAGFLCVIV